MKTRWLVAWCSIFLVGIGLGGAPILACGDKALVPSRAKRFNLTPGMRRQVAVLVYLEPKTPVYDLFNRLSAEATLRKAGFQVTIENDKTRLADQLKNRWDVIVVDLQEILAGPAPSNVPNVPVLAVAVKPTDSDVKGAKGKYSALVKSPSRSQMLIVKLDDLVASRFKASKKI